MSVSPAPEVFATGPLATAITRTRAVIGVQAGQVAGTYLVTFAVQPTASTPAYTQQETLSAAEWNELASRQGTGGGAGIGVTVATTSQ